MMTAKEIEGIQTAFYETFSTNQGQIVLDYLVKGYLHRTSFVPNDPYSTSFHEGQRDIVRSIYEKVEQAKSPTQLEDFYE